MHEPGHPKLVTAGLRGSLALDEDLRLVRFLSGPAILTEVDYRVQNAYNPMTAKPVNYWKDWSGRRDLNPGPPEPHSRFATATNSSEFL
jgi:hypothetical protein